VALSLDEVNVAATTTASPAPHAPACVPPEMPLAMPAQALRRYERGKRVRASIWNRLARLTTFAGAWTVTGFGTYEMYLVVQLGGVTPLEWMMVVMFAITFGWIALSATACVAIEDSTTGVTSAEAAGCTVLVVENHVRVDPGPRRIFRETLVGLTLQDLCVLVN